MNNKNLLLIICAIIVLVIIIWLIAVKRADNPDNVTITTEEASEEETYSASTDLSDSSNLSDSSDSSYLSDVTAFTSEEDTLMHIMMEEMMSVEPSGNADIDFLLGMIPHHRSAIEISESYLNHNPQNPDMITLAQNIILVQQEEINTMNDLVNSITEEGTVDHENAESYQYEYTQLMHTRHSHSTNEYNSVDQAFAEGMAEHHQMAVDMAYLILRYSNNDQVKELAQNIIDSQEKEIEEMNNFLNSLT